MQYRVVKGRSLPNLQRVTGSPPTRREQIQLNYVFVAVLVPTCESHERPTRHYKCMANSSNACSRALLVRYRVLPVLLSSFFFTYSLTERHMKRVGLESDRYRKLYQATLQLPNFPVPLTTFIDVARGFERPLLDIVFSLHSNRMVPYKDEHSNMPSSSCSSAILSF